MQGRRSEHGSDVKPFTDLERAALQANVDLFNRELKSTRDGDNLSQLLCLVANYSGRDTEAQLKIIDKLLRDKRVDPNYKDHNQANALYYARSAPAIVIERLTKKIDFNAECIPGWSPLDQCELVGNEQGVRTLEQAGAARIRSSEARLPKLKRENK